jgi:hypothetical protein
MGTTQLGPECALALKDVIRVKIPKKWRIVDDFVPKKSTRKRDELAEVKADRSAAQKETTLLRKKRESKMIKAQAEYVKNRRGRIGCIVSIASDKRDQPQGRGLLGILFAVSKSRGWCGVTKHGIISHGKGYLWVPIDRYKVLSDIMPGEEELYNLRHEVLKDDLLTNRKATAFRLEYKTAEGKDEIVGEADVKSEYQKSLVSCKCKRGCTKRCQCVKIGRGCGRTCVCRGSCDFCLTVAFLTKALR